MGFNWKRAAKTMVNPTLALNNDAFNKAKPAIFGADFVPTEGMTPEQLIAHNTPEAMRLINEGADKQLGYSQQAQQQYQGLGKYGGTEALDQQNALLGILGGQAQQQAIQNIPVSAFDRQQERRGMEGLARQAFAGGDVSGASMEGMQNLGANQMFGRVQNRLGQLEPLVSQGRAIASTLSGADEQARAQQAGIASGRGSQLANIQLGAAAPLISSIMNQAELSGLQGMSQASQKADMYDQLADLAGRGMQSYKPSVPETNVRQVNTNQSMVGGTNVLTGANLNYSPAYNPIYGK